MQPTLLISRTDFAQYIEIPPSISDAKINNRILEAMNFDLRTLMGDKFYYWFIALTQDPGLLTIGGSYMPTVEDYIDPTQFDGWEDDFWIGYDFANVSDILFQFYGLNPVLVYYSAARMIRSLDVNFTPFGLKAKHNDFSDPVDPKILRDMAMQYQNQGLAYWNMCAKYLDSQPTLYPLWQNGCGEPMGNPRTSAKISSIGATPGVDYPVNYRGGGAYYGI